jgi:hypothetical protein
MKWGFFDETDWIPVIWYLAAFAFLIGVFADGDTVTNKDAVIVCLVCAQIWAARYKPW